MSKTRRSKRGFAIQPDAWYSLKQIAERGWITNSNGKGDRFYLHRLVKGHRLLARDFGVSRKIMRVRGRDILAFRRANYL